MSRQYGIQPGFQDRSGASTRAPVSPVEAYHPSQASWLRDHNNSAPVSGFSSTAPSISGSPTRTKVPPLMAAPVPPRHRELPPSPTRTRHQSSTTPDEDNYSSAAAGGGVTGLALGTANRQPRDSGVQALRDIDNLYGGGRDMMTPSPQPEYIALSPPRRPVHQPVDSQNSIAPLMAGRSSPPRQSPSPKRSRSRYTPIVAAGMPNDSMPRAHDPRSDPYDGYVNPHQIADDNDDGYGEPQPQHQHQQSRLPASLMVGGGAGAAAGGASGMLNSFGKRDRSGNYGPLPGGGGHDPEKSDWLQSQSSGKKRMKWIVGSIIAVLVVAAIVGGAVGGILASKKNSSASTTSSTSSSKGLYDINSPQVKSLLNNPSLHRVFPGMDYTPLNTQYPDCLTNPPDQNNVTLDVAMLAQLTPAIRLYGTDCNQTEMLLAGINQLGYNDTVKVWLGVWLGNNATTNTRQLQQMYDVLDTYPTSHFAGVIVGNEVLFREDMTEAELGQQLQNVRTNLTAKKIDLPVATSDLGDNWNATLAVDTDIVMSNVHPFFAGVTPDEAPGWTWNFWQTHDVILTGASATGSGGYPKNIISEVGWPSSGGNDCGDDTCTSTTAGAVASVDNMNAFMDGWICQSLQNATTYFWFEAFDEPWKVIFNTDTDQWESKWGLMDSNRNVKPGLKIPDCGGQTVDKPY